MNRDVMQIELRVKGRIVNILPLEAYITLYLSVYNNTAFPKHAG